MWLLWQCHPEAVDVPPAGCGWTLFQEELGEKGAWGPWPQSHIPQLPAGPELGPNIQPTGPFHLQSRPLLAQATVTLVSF